MPNNDNNDEDGAPRERRHLEIPGCNSLTIIITH
jgi:hypothetical protein